MHDLRPLAGRWLRIMTPRWAHAPLSGEGARRTGGRFNRPGQAALYLSEDVATAWAEYQQMGSLPRPGLAAVYEVRAERVAELALPGEPLPPDLGCPWRKLWRIDHVEPPTWPAVDRLIAAGAQGAVYPSVARPAGRNLVLWLDGPDVPAEIGVVDPADDLPRDALSWSEGAAGT